MDLIKFTCLESSTILEALKKIDANKSSFIIVLDEYNNVIATLTDGDIRRALLNDYNVTDKVSVAYNDTFKKLDINNSIGDAIELFKNNAIKFLPIVENNKLVNIITKSQLQSLLLQDLNVDLKYDFTKLDENIVNTEIFTRPWGFYKTTVLNDYYQSKVITVKPNEQLSLQSHTRRDEYWIITHGSGLFIKNEETKEVKAGDMLYIPRETKHRIKNIDEKESLIITEVQLGDYFGEDDIIRYDDQYGRN